MLKILLWSIPVEGLPRTQYRPRAWPKRVTSMISMDTHVSTIPQNLYMNRVPCRAIAYAWLQRPKKNAAPVHAELPCVIKLNSMAARWAVPSFSKRHSGLIC